MIEGDVSEYMKKTSYSTLIKSIVFIGIISITIFWYMSNKNNKKYIQEESYEVITRLEDKFFISEKLIMKYPDYIYDVEVFDYSNAEKKLILTLDRVEDVPNEKINVLYSDIDIRAYIYIDCIIYKEKTSEDFRSLDILDCIKLDPDEYAYLIPVAKELVSRNWRPIVDVLEFLIKSNDTDTINKVKRYAQGRFTLEEIEDMKYPASSRDDLQDYSKSLLIKYNLQD